MFRNSASWIKKILMVAAIGILLSVCSCATNAPHDGKAAGFPPGSPEAISRSYLEMLKQKQWSEIATLYDPKALSDFREMMAFIYEMPDEVSSKVLPSLFGPGSTKESIKSMSDLQFFSSFLQGIMAQAAQVGQLDFKKIDILGSVSEGDSLRHVVTRTYASIGDIDMESMEVISFRKSDDKWRIMMQGKMKGMAQHIRKALTQKAIKQGAQ